MWKLVSLAIGYLAGMLLTAELVVRRRRGESVFAVGSGNPGMANVMAECGFAAGITVLAGDLAKTVAACLAARFLVLPLMSVAPGPSVLSLPALAASSFKTLPEIYAETPANGAYSMLYAGLGVVLGHNYPVWHRFRGGKGVSATCAALFLFHPLWGLISAACGMFIVFLSGYLPVGAVFIPAVFIPVCGLLLGREAALIALALTALMIIAHAGGIAKAYRGTEKVHNVPELIVTKLFKAGPDRAFLVYVVTIAVSGLLLYAALLPWYRIYRDRDYADTCYHVRYVLTLEVMEEQKDYFEASGEYPDQEWRWQHIADKMEEKFGVRPDEDGAAEGICRAGGVYSLVRNADGSVSVYCSETGYREHETGTAVYLPE